MWVGEAADKRALPHGPPRVLLGLADALPTPCPPGSPSPVLLQKDVGLCQACAHTRVPSTVTRRDPQCLGCGCVLVPGTE